MFTREEIQRFIAKLETERVEYVREELQLEQKIDECTVLKTAAQARARRNVDLMELLQYWIENDYPDSMPL